MLLILAGITIATLTGENGVLTKASTSKDETKKAEYEEIINIIIAEKQIERKTNQNNTKTLIEMVAEEIKKRSWAESVILCDEEENTEIEPAQGTRIIVETVDDYEIVVDIDNEWIAVEVNKIEGSAEIITVKFDANGATGEVPEEIARKKGRSITLPGAENLVKEDYKFVGWSGNATESPENVNFKVGSRFKLIDNVTLYAIWAYDTREISFDSNGGTGTMESINVVTGKNSNLPNNKFSKEGYKFKEWNTNADGNGTKYSNEGEIRITEDTRLYAIWEEDIILGSITPTSMDVRMGTTSQITALSTKGKAIDGNKVTWSTSNSSIITVQNGVVTPRGYGSASVTACLPDRPSLTKVCNITVVPGSSSFNIFQYHQIKGTTVPTPVVAWQRTLWMWAFF